MGGRPWTDQVDGAVVLEACVMKRMKMIAQEGKGRDSGKTQVRGR